MQVTKQVGKRKAAVDTFTLKTTQGEEKVEFSTNRNVLFETLRQDNQLDKSDYQRAGYGLKTLMYHPIMTLASNPINQSNQSQNITTFNHLRDLDSLPWQNCTNNQIFMIV